MSSDKIEYTADKRAILHGISSKEKEWLEKVLERVREVRKDTGDGVVHVFIEQGKVKSVNILKKG